MHRAATSSSANERMEGMIMAQTKPTSDATKWAWNSADEDERFDRLKAIGFSKHDAGIMAMLKFDKLPRYVQASLA